MLLKNNSKIVIIIAIMTEINIESLAISLASLSYLGKTIAIGYVKAAIGIIIAITAVKTPSTPNASGPYNLVITGVNSSVISCAAAVPVARIITFFTNGLLISLVII